MHSGHPSPQEEGLGKRLVYAVALFLSLILLNAPHGEASQERPAPSTPKDTYLDFRELVTAKRYDKAYALLDGNARSEFKAAATVLLRMVMTGGGTLEGVSDLELFRLFMTFRAPDDFEFISEEIQEDTALVRGRIREGPSARPASILLKKIAGTWLIHSTTGRVSPGEDGR